MSSTSGGGPVAAVNALVRVPRCALQVPAGHACATARRVRRLGSCAGPVRTLNGWRHDGREQQVKGEGHRRGGGGGQSVCCKVPPQLGRCAPLLRCPQKTAKDD